MRNKNVGVALRNVKKTHSIGEEQERDDTVAGTLSRRRQQTSLVAEYLVAQGTTHPGTDEFQSLLKSIDVYDGQEKNKIVAHARRIARQRMTEPLSEKQRDIVKQVVSELASSHSVRAICDEIEKQMSVPRFLLHRAVVGALKSLGYKSLTPQQRRIVKHHIDLSPHPHDTKALVAELGGKLQVSRVVLQHMVANALPNTLAKHVSREQCIALEDHIAQSKHNNIPQLCDELQSMQLSIPRSVLSLLIKKILYRRGNERLTDDQRELIRDFVARAPHSAHTLEICDELQEHLPIPRTVLHDIVRRYQQQNHDHSLSKEQREVLKVFIEQLPDCDTTSQLCQKIQRQQHFVNTPHHVLYSHIYSLTRRSQVTPQVQRRVFEHVKQRTSESTPSVEQLSEELYSELAIPKVAVRQLVRKSVHRLSKKKITKHQRELILAHVQQSHDPGNLSALCDELQHDMTAIPRSVLYDLLVSARLSHFTKILTADQKEQLRACALQAPQKIDEVCEQMHQQDSSIPKQVLLTYAKKG